MNGSHQAIYNLPRRPAFGPVAENYRLGHSAPCPAVVVAATDDTPAAVGIARPFGTDGKAFAAASRYAARTWCRPLGALPTRDKGLELHSLSI